uniref:DNA-directed RNA polymerase III subunit n=4 Tax=Gossypium TaxID=3633 RepID=A0A0D2QBB3_GOSRA|nr:hypothetical protein B456_006G164500 [Gossypium raimondii]
MHIRVCNEATKEQFPLQFYVANQKWYKQYKVLRIQDPLEKGNFSVVLENGDRLLKSTWNCLLPSSGSLTSTTNRQPSQWVDMSFRGRGRGRGRGFGGRGFGGYVPPEPFVLFPDIELPDVKAVPEEKILVVWNSRLLNYWKASPYYLEEHVSKKSQSMDIERFSDWGKPKNTSKRDSLNQVLQLQSHNFPKELIGDSKRAQRSAKRMRWNLDSGLEKLDVFEKFEKDGDKEGKEKGDGEEENSDEEQGAQSDESYSDDGDYNENEHFDDDEDDYNIEDDHDDEPIY